MSDEHYGKILHSFWTDPRIKRRLSRDGKLLLAYYFSSPHKNMTGVYPCPIAYASDETGIDPETIRGLLLTLKEFVTFDPETDEIFVHGMAETAIGEELKAGDTKRKHLERHLSAVHSTRLLHLFHQRYARWGLKVRIPDQRQPLVDTLSDTPSQGVADTRAVKEQEPNRPEEDLVEQGSTAVSLTVIGSVKPAKAKSLETVQARLAAVLAGVVADGRRRVGADEMRRVKAELVFAYWASKLDHPKALLDAERERRLTKRLEENGGDVHELLYVVDGALKDEWTMGRSQRSTKKFDGIETIYQDRAHVEKFAAMCPAYKAGDPHPMATKYLASAEVA